MPKVSNSKARQKVMNRQEFTGSNTFGRWTGSTINSYYYKYVVYSYGEHFPLFVWCPITTNWYVNSDKYSTSTSRHKSQLSPLCHCIEMTTSELKSLINPN